MAASTQIFIALGVTAVTAVAMNVWATRNMKPPRSDGMEKQGDGSGSSTG